MLMSWNHTYVLQSSGIPGVKEGRHLMHKYLYHCLPLNMQHDLFFQGYRYIIVPL